MQIKNNQPKKLLTYKKCVNINIVLFFLRRIIKHGKAAKVVKINHSHLGARKFLLDFKYIKY